MRAQQIHKLQLLGTRAFRNAKTIAVVGNAGTNPEDHAKIEAADCVVRFNNYATRGKINHTKDRFRCDVLFSTFDLHSEGAKPLDVVIAIPFPFNSGSIVKKLDKWYPKSMPFMVNPYLNMLACDELGFPGTGYTHPIPSVGTTCLYHLYYMIQTIISFNPSVFVAGFNWYSNKEKLTIQNRKVDQPQAKHFNHHYREEMRWTINKLMGHPKFSFSDSCFDILQSFNFP